MDVLNYVMAGFAILGAADYLLGSKFGIGKEFERGIMLLGTMMLTMVGMIVISPLFALAMKPLTNVMTGALDPSVIPAILLANDMGGAHLAVEVAKNEQVGLFNAFVVSSMMGATISFTVPYALGVVGKERRPDMLLGLLCGIVTIPVGCFVGGLIMKISVGLLLINLLPLVVISAVIGFGIVKFPDACVKIFGIFGTVIKVIVIAGLTSAIFDRLTGIKLIPYTDSMDSGISIIVNAACVMTGAFPLVSIIARLLKKPFTKLGKKIGMNEVSMVGVVSTLATNATTLGVMDEMDKRGATVNSAFAVSAAFTFAAHLGFTIAFAEELGLASGTLVAAVIVGKLVAGISSLAVAFWACRKIPISEPSESGSAAEGSLADEEAKAAEIL